MESEDHVAELDRLDEENRLNDLHFADDSSFSNESAINHHGDDAVLDLQNFIRPRQLNESDDDDMFESAAALDNSRSRVVGSRVSPGRSVADRYAVTLSESMERETTTSLLTGRSHSIETEVTRLTREIHAKTAEIQAQKMQLTHLALQVRSLTDSEVGHRAERDSARLAHASAEQDRMLLEARLKEVAGFEGQTSNISVEGLRGKLLDASTIKLQELADQLFRVRNTSEQQLYELQERLFVSQSEKQGLVDELAKTCEKVAQLTVLYSARERETHHTFHAQSSELTDTQTKLIQSQAQCKLLSDQCRQLSEDKMQLALTLKEAQTRLQELTNKNSSLEDMVQTFQSDQVVLTQHNLQLQSLVDSYGAGQAGDLLANALGEVDRLKAEAVRKDEQFKKQIESLRGQLSDEINVREQLEGELLEYRQELYEKDALLAKLHGSYLSENAFSSPRNSSMQSALTTVSSAVRLQAQPSMEQESGPAYSRMVYHTHETSRHSSAAANESMYETNASMDHSDLGGQSAAAPQATVHGELDQSISAVSGAGPDGPAPAGVVDESMLLGSPGHNISIYSDQHSVDNSDAVSWLVPSHSKIKRLREENKTLQAFIEKVLSRASQLGLDMQLDGAEFVPLATAPPPLLSPLAAADTSADADRKLLDALRGSVAALTDDRSRLSEQVLAFKAEVHHLQELCDSTKEVGRQEAILLHEHSVRMWTQQVSSLQCEKRELEEQLLALQEQQRQAIQAKVAEEVSLQKGDEMAGVLTRLRQEHERLEDDLMKATQERSDMSGAVTRHRLQCEELRAQVDMLTLERDKLQDQVIDLAKTLDELGTQGDRELWDEERRALQEELELQRTTWEAKVEALHAQVSSRDQIQLSVDELAAQRDQAIAEVRRWEHMVEEKSEELSALRAESTSLQEEVALLGASREEARSGVVRLQAREQEVASAIEHMLAQQAAQQETVAELEARVEGLIKQISVLEGESEQVEALAARSEILRQEISQQDVLWVLKSAHLQRTSGELAQITAELENAREALDTLIKAQCSVTLTVKDTSSAAATLSKIQEQVEVASVEQRLAQDRLAALHSATEKAATELNEVNDQICADRLVCASLQASAEESSKELRDIQLQLSQVSTQTKVVNEQARAAREEVESLRVKEEVLTATIAAKSAELAQVQAAVATAQTQHDALVGGLRVDRALVEEVHALRQRLASEEARGQEATRLADKVAEELVVKDARLATIESARALLQYQLSQALSKGEELGQQAVATAEALRRTCTEHDLATAVQERAKRDLEGQLAAQGSELERLLLVVSKFEAEHAQGEAKFKEIMHLYCQSTENIQAKVGEVMRLKEATSTMTERVTQLEERNRTLEVAATSAAADGRRQGETDLRELREMVRLHQRTLEQQAEEADQGMEQMRAKHEQEVKALKSTLRRQFKKFIEDQERTQRAREAALREEHARQCAELRRTLADRPDTMPDLGLGLQEQAQEALRQQHRCDLDELRQQLDAVRQSKLDDTSRMVSRHREEVDTLRKQHQLDLEEKSRELRLLRETRQRDSDQLAEAAGMHLSIERAQAELVAVTQKHAALLSEHLQLQHAAHESRVAQEGWVREREALVQAAAAAQVELETLRRQLQAAQTAAASDDQHLRANLADSVSRQQVVLRSLEEAQTRLLLTQTELSQARQELSTLRAELNDRELGLQTALSSLQARYQDLQEHFDRVVQENEALERRGDVNKYHRAVQTEAVETLSPPRAVVAAEAALQGPWTLHLDPRQQETALLTVDMVPAHELQAKLQQQKTKYLSKLQHKLEKLQAQHAREKEDMLALVRRECQEILAETQALRHSKKELGRQQEQLLGLLLQIDARLGPALLTAPKLRESLSELRESLQDHLLARGAQGRGQGHGVSPGATPDSAYDAGSQMDHLLAKLGAGLGTSLTDSVTSSQPPLFPSSEPALSARTSKPVDEDFKGLREALKTSSEASPQDIAHSRRYFAAHTVTPPHLPIVRMLPLHAQGPSAGHVAPRVFPEMLSPDETEALLSSVSHRTPPQSL